MRVITEEEATRDLDALWDAIEEGETIGILRDGEPVAVISPVEIPPAEAQ